MATARPPAVGPRPLTWLLLGTLVLLAHAWLLGGGTWADADPMPAEPSNAAGSTGLTDQARPSGQTQAAAKPAPARTAQVRWIEAPIPPQAQAIASPPKPAVKPKPRPKPQPKLPPAAPPAPLPVDTSVDTPVAQTPLPTEPHTPDEPALAEAPTPVDTAAAATEPTEPNPPAPEPAPEPTPAPPSTAASDAIPAAPDTAEPARPATPAGNRWLRYDVTGQAKGLNYRASADIRWQHADGRYVAEYTVRAFLLGSRSQRSEGRLTERGLQPERFTDKSRSERAAHFEPEQGRIRFSNNAPDAEWLPGTQDRLSVFFQLAAWLNAQPESLREGQQFRVPVAGTSARDQWLWVVQASERLDLPAGSWDTLRVAVLPQKTYDQRIEIWLAPALEHLPVRIRITQANGDVADQQLSGIP